MDRLSENVLMWGVYFNTTKSKILISSRKRNPIGFTFSPNGCQIPTVKQKNNLGVIIDTKLKYDKPIENSIAICYRELVI